MKQLGRLHSNFYPHPVNLTIIPGDPGEVRMERIETGFLTKGELINLWNLCGGVLHRGTMKNITNQLKTPVTLDLGAVFGWTNKIIMLLRTHHIASLDNQTHFICVLEAQDRGGNALVAMAQSPLPQ